jgi:predicted dehydrogenase
MMDFGCHRLEVLTNLFGGLSRVTGIATNNIFPDREVEDTAVALLKFERGPVASVTVTHAAAEPQDTLDIFGTKGSVHIPVLNAAEMRIISGGTERAESHPTHANVHQPLIEDFVQAVLDGGQPKVGGETGRAIAELEEKILG